MTIQEFKRDFCFKVTEHNQVNVSIIIITEAIRREGNRVIDRVKTTTPLNLQQLIEETKRAHLDYFAQRVPIEDWYPLDKQNNPDISDFY